MNSPDKARGACIQSLLQFACGQKASRHRAAVFLWSALVLLGAATADAATYYSRATGDWNVNTTWSLTSGGAAVGVGTNPVAGDTVIIERGFTVTVAASEACGSVQLGSTATTTSSGTLTFSGENPSLTVSGAVLLGSTTYAARAGTITFTSGATLSAGSLTLGGSAGSGTLTMTAGGTLIAGSLALGAATTKTWTPGTGTVILTGTSTLPATIFTAFNHLTIDGGTTAMGASLAINGNLDVQAGGFTIGAFTLAVTGTTTVNGTLSITSPTGTKSFTGDVTINSGGSWINSGNEDVSFGGSLVNNGTTFTAGSGTCTFNGTGAQSLTGATTFGSLTVNNSTGVTLNSTPTVTGTLTLADGQLDNSVHNVTLGNGATISRASGSLAAVPAFGAAVNVAYTAGGVTTGPELPTSTTVLQALSLNHGSGTVTLGADATVNGTFTIASGGIFADGGFRLTAKSAVSNSGTHSSSGSGGILFAGGTAQSFAGTYGNVEMNNAAGTSLSSTTTINGNLTVTAGTFTVGAVTLTVTGTTTVTSTLAITSTTGAKQFADVTVNGTWNNSANEAVAITGNLANNGTFTAGSGTYTLSGSGKTLAGTISIPNLTMTGTYANGGSLTVATLLTVTSPGVLTNNGTITATTALSGTGTLTQGTESTLNYGGTVAPAITALNATASPNTVDYNLAGGQTVKAVPYHHLTLSGSGAKTMTGVATIGGSLTLSGSATMTGNAAFTVAGALNYGSSGSTTLTATTPISIGTFNQTAGTLVDNANTITITGTGANTWSAPGGTFTTTGTVVFTGPAPQIGADTFNHLTINVGSGNTATLGVGVSVSGTLTLADGQLDNSVHNVTLGNGATISRASGSLIAVPAFGAAVNVAYTAGGVTTGPELPTSTTVLQALSLNHGSGTVTLGADATVNGTFTIASGGIFADGGFRLTAKSAVSNSGTHSSSGSGGILFAGGTAQSFAGTYGNVEMNNAAGTSLSSTTTINGNLTVTAGTFTVGAVTLTVTGTTTVTSTLAITSTTGTKQFADVTVNGSWNNSANEAVAITGNLANNGTFTAGSGTYTLSGSGKTLAGTISIPNLTVTGTYANSGSLTVATLLTVTSPGVLTNNGTITATTSLAGTGELTQGVNAALNIGGTSAITTLTATAEGNTVNYTGAAQTVHNNNYWHLTLSGSLAKTLGAGMTAIGGNLTLGGTASATLAVGLAVGGSVTLGTGTTLDASTSNYPISVGGNWSNSGTFTARAGTVTFNGAGEQTIHNNNSWFGLALTGGGRTVYFQSGMTQTVSAGGALTLTGASDNLLTLAPLTGGSAWNLSVNATASQSVSHVSVSYSNAGGGAAINASDGTNADGDNNTNWYFVYTTYYSTGSVNANATASWKSNRDGSGSSPVGFAGADTFVIQDGDSMTVSSAWTLSDMGSKVQIESGGALTADSANVSAYLFQVDAGGTVTVNGTRTLTINNSASAPDLILNGTLVNSGTLTLASSTLAVGSTGIYRHAQNGGTIPAAAWDPASTLEVTGWTSSTVNPVPTGQAYGNFTWNSPSQTATVSLGGRLTAVNGNLTVASTGSGVLELAYSEAYTLTIGGDLMVQAGSLYASVWYAPSTPQYTLNINGDLIVQGGVLNFCAGSSSVGDSSNPIINLGGNFNQSGGTIQAYAGLASPYALPFNFTGANKTFTKTAGTFTGHYFAFHVATGASLTLNSVFSVGTSATYDLLTVDSGGTLNVGTYANSKYVSGSGKFTVAAGGTLGIGDPYGILTGTGTGATGGSIQVTGTRTYDTGANYVYNGTAAQVTGNGLTTANNLMIANSAGVTLSGAVTVSDTLALAEGALSIGANTLTLNGAIATTGGSLTGGASANITFGGAGASTTLPTVASGLQNLTVNRANGIALDPTVTVNGTLTLTSGQVTDADNLTLGDGATISRAAGSLDAVPVFGTSVNVTYTAGGVTTGLELPVSTTVLQALALNHTSSAVILGANATVNGAFSTTAGGTFADGGFTLTAKGSVSNAGTITGDGKLLLAGGSAQTLAGAGGYGNLELNNAAGASLNANTTINGNLTITTGTFTAGAFNLTVVGLTTVTDTLAITSTTGTKIFGDVTVNGTWENTANEAVTISGHLVNNGILNAGTGIYTLSGTSKAINGTLSIPSLTVTGTYANSGTLTVATLLTVTAPGVLTNNGTITAATALSGTGGLTQGAGATLTIGGTSGITTLGATAAGNTVNFNGGAQTVKATAYHHLGLSGSGAKALTSVSTVNGNLMLGGTATATTATGLNIGGNLDIGDGTTFTVAGYALTVTGATTVGGGTSGNLSISSATGTKIFTGLVTVNAGGSWNNTTANSPVTIRGGIANSGTFNAGTGVYTFDTNSQALTGTFSIPSVTVTGVTLTNNNTLTVATALAGTGGLTQGAGATLNIGATAANLTITTLTATANPNTVNYNLAGAQTVKAVTYHDLTLSGSGAKTLTGLTTVNGDLTLSGTATASTGANLAIGGALSVGNGTTLTAANNLTVTGATTADGTLTLSGANTFGGGVALNAPGLLNLNSAGALGGGVLTINGGTLNNTLGSAVTLSSDSPQNWNGDFAFTGSSSLNLANGAVAMNNHRIVTVNGNTLSVGGDIGGAYNLTKAGAGTLALAGDNAFSGVLAVQAGTLSIPTINSNNVAGPLGQSGNDVVLGGTATLGTLRYTGTDATPASDKGFAIGVSGDTSAYGGVIQVDNSGTTLTLSGQVYQVNQGLLTKTGSGQLVLAGTDNNFSLGVVVNTGGGTVVLGKTSSRDVHAIGGAGLTIGGGSVQLGGTGGDQIYDFGPVTVNSGTFDLNGRSETFVPLRGTGGTILNNGGGASTLTVGVAGTGGDGTNTSVMADNTSGGGTLALVKDGTGTLTLRGANTYTGGSTAREGTLTLDYSTAVGSKLADAGVLTLSGGTVSLSGGASAHTEVVGAVTVDLGASAVTHPSGYSVLRQNTITRNVGGTVNYGAASIAQTDNSLVNGILGGWATVAGTGWATSGGVNDSLITALATYQLDANPANWVAANNVSRSGNPSANVTTRAINSLRLTAAATVTIATDNMLTLSSGGLLVTGSGATAITGGTLTGGAGTDLVVFQNATAGLTISSDIADNTSATALTKSGTGTLILNTTAKTYTGGTHVNAGTLDVQVDGGLGSGNVRVASGATLKLNLGTTHNYIDDAATVSLAGSARMNLAFSGADTFASLVINGVPQAKGTWGATGSGASHIDDTHFTGTGILDVVNATTTALESSLNPSLFGQSVTFTATVAGAFGTPTGTVQFMTNGASFGAPVALGEGVAILTTAALPGGTTAVTAEYSGDDFFSSSTGTLSGGQTVDKADQTITFPAIGDQETTNEVGLAATASSGLPVAFTVFSGPATISGLTNLAFTGAGEVKIVASQSGNGNWNAAAEVTNTFNVVFPPGPEINSSTVNVREAGEGRFYVRLNFEPEANVEVNVTRWNGNAQLFVQGGAALTFTPENWTAWQMVTLAQAADDGNSVNETATFQISATGLADQFVDATALDDDGLGENLALASVGAMMTRGGVPIQSLRATDGIHNSSVNYVFTKWTNDPPETMTLDLMFTSNVSRVRLLNWNWDARVHRYTIEASADGSSWSTLVDASAEDHRGWDDWPGTASVRYLRFTGQANSAGDSVCIAEWEVYGARILPPPPVPVANQSTVNVRENGEGRFFVKLDWVPVGNVNVTVATATGGDADLTVKSGSSLTFTPLNWNMWQVVTLAAASDADTANGTATINLTAPDVAVVTVTAQELDDDIGENLALASAGSTITGGSNPARTIDGSHLASANYGYTAWTTDPKGTMTLDLNRVATVTRIRLLNWDWNYRVHRYTIEASVNGSDWSTLLNASAEDHQGWDDWMVANQAIRYLRFTGLSSSVGSLVCIPEWEVYSASDLLPAPVVSQAALNVRENGEGRLFVKLAQKPVASTVVTIAKGSGDADLTAKSGGTLTFTPANWNAWQVATLQAADDEDAANGTAIINVSYPGSTVAPVTATELDDDIGGSNLALGSAITGGAYAIRLIDGSHMDSGNYGWTTWTSQPPGSVTLDLKKVATVTQIRLLNWDWTYRVHEYKIETSATGTDWTELVDTGAGAQRGWDDWTVPVEKQSMRYLKFTGLANSANPSVCIPEWEVWGTLPTLPAPVVSQAAVNVRENGEGRFYVKLAEKPAASTAVAVAPASGGDEDITVASGGTLTFTPANWSTWQLVTLVAADDEDAVNGTATINVSYPGSAGAEVVATELDDDDLGDNLALTSAGSTITGSYGFRAIDGIHNSSVNYGYATWGTGAKPMVLDLKSAVTVSRIRLLNWDWGYRLHRYTLEHSLNGTDWTPLATSGAAAQRGWDDWTVEEVSLQYLRFTGLENSVNAAVCVAELEVYGPPPGPLSLPKALVKVAPEPEPVSVLTSDGPEDATGWNAVDGDVSTAWIGQKAGSGYLVIEYQPVLMLSALDVDLAEDSLSGMEVFTSQDGVEWQPLPEDAATKPVSLNFLWLVFPDDGSAAGPNVLEIWPNP